MKNVILAAALALLSAPVFAQDVGVSVSIGQPGFYGQIILGNAPPPELIYSQPVIVVPGPAMPPVYLHVPPGHERHWRRYCHDYDACGRPVYFVRDGWYNDVYVPHYRRHEDEYRHHRGEWRERDEDRGRGYERGERPGFDRGPGPGYERRDERRDEGRGERRRDDEDRGR